MADNSNQNIGGGDASERQEGSHPPPHGGHASGAGAGPSDQGNNHGEIGVGQTMDREGHVDGRTSASFAAPAPELGPHTFVFGGMGRELSGRAAGRCIRQVYGNATGRRSRPSGSRSRAHRGVGGGRLGAAARVGLGSGRRQTAQQTADANAWVGGGNGNATGFVSTSLGSGSVVFSGGPGVLAAAYRAAGQRAAGQRADENGWVWDANGHAIGYAAPSTSLGLRSVVFSGGPGVLAAAFQVAVNQAEAGEGAADQSAGGEAAPDRSDSEESE